MSPINHLPSMDPLQKRLDESNNLDRRLSNGVDEKKIEHDRVKEAYKNFSIEKEGTSFTTSFKNFADLIFLKPLGFKTFQESSVKKNNEKYFNAGGPDYLNERDPKQQETQPQDNKSQKPKEGFSVVAALKKFFKVTSVPKQVRDDITIINTNPKYQFNFTEPKDEATIEVNPVSKVEISNQSREASQKPSGFKKYREMAGEVMAERGVSDGRKWEERVLANYSDENPLQDTNNSGVNASSKSSSGQGLDSAEPSSKTPQPPQSLAQIIPTGEQKRLRAAILNMLGQEGETNSAPVSSEEKSQQRSNDQQTAPLKRLQSLFPTVANNPEHSSPTTTPVEEPQKEPLPKKERAPSSGPGLYAWRDKPTPKPDPERRIVDGLLPIPQISTYRESEVSNPNHIAGSTHNGPEIRGRMAEAIEAEKALAKLEASKAQKAPSRQTKVAKKEIISPCGHRKYESKHSQEGEVGFVASLATSGTGGKGGRGAGG